MASPEPAHPQPVPIIPTHQPSLPFRPLITHHHSSPIIPTCPDLPKLSNLKKSYASSMIYHCHCHYCCHVLFNAMLCNAMLYSLLFISVYLLLFYLLLLTSFYLLFTYFSRERARSRMRVRVRELHACVSAYVCVYLRICVHTLHNPDATPTPLSLSLSSFLIIKPHRTVLPVLPKKART